MRKLLIGIAAAGAILGAVSPAVAADGYGGSNGNGNGKGKTKDFSREFGDVEVDEQAALINQNGAPLVYADLNCAAPWMGGVIHATIGNQYAACNTGKVTQAKTGGLIS
ncbi:hypothetical protein J7I98_11455 [Streptomyces sp. ISL-98]|uniref:hypothetical protein n=1 Tax=Streptomyces sp. ISL-98 TaxID=2819192 RepID=UPI001BEBAB63|nr:hypothetical protein [Streptomyces sp. ISL-98]MBT2506503.1 hypothetical protein [Streptomyces sp. ISL-98]